MTKTSASYTLYHGAAPGLPASADGRQPDRKRRPPPVFRLEIDRAVVGLDDLPDDRQAQPRPLDRLRVGALDPEELGEDQRDVLFGYADAGVGKPDDAPAVLGRYGDGKRAARAVILDGVADEVAEGLPEGALVPGNPGGSPSTASVAVNAALRR